MATLYISSGSGADNGSGYTSQSSPAKTIQAALISSSASDTLEIIDQEIYYVNNQSITTDNITITHTSSHLGRPHIKGTGAPSSTIFRLSGDHMTFINLEMSNAVQPFYNAGSEDSFHLSGCFLHDVQRLHSHAIVGDPSDQTSINECVIYFANNMGHGALASPPILVYSDVIIKNCLITCSADNNDGIMWDYGFNGDGDVFTSTASFSTFINTPGASTTDPIMKVGKIINCIVSGTGKGIYSDDHTYNLAITSEAAVFSSIAGASASAATGDIVNQNPVFVDGTAAGSSPSIAANFKLQSTSPCVDSGVSYGNITTDISGNTRGQRYWNSYSTPTKPKFAVDFTINLDNNLTAQHKTPGPVGANDLGAYEYVDPTRDVYEGIHPAIDQVPISLSLPGAPTLRGRSTAYITTQNNPSKVISGSS